MESENNTRPNPEEIQELLNDDAPAAPEPYIEPVHQPRSLDFLYDVPLEVSVEVGRSKILLKDLLNMGEGYVIELDKAAGAPLDLYVNSQLIARGEAVMVGDKFGIRLIDVVSTSDRLENLSK